MANIITGIRIGCALCLIFCPTYSIWFYFLYIAGGISDILDGIVARKLGKSTEFGARLDTIADILFIGIALTKAIAKIYVSKWLIIWIICIAVIKIINIIIGFALYNRFVTEHTVLNKICGVLIFAVLLFIGHLPWQPVVILIAFTCTVSSFTALQECLYICIGKNIR